MRLFIAIELPDQIKSMLGALRADIPGARWVPPEQLHLTLSFLGEVDEPTASLLTEGLATIQAPGFKLRFGGLGCFPDSRRPRVLWIGLKAEPLLMNLADLVRAKLLEYSIPQEERPFSPHITLARFKLPAGREVGAYLEQHSLPYLPPVTVEEFQLFQSRLTSKGALHTPLGRFPLQSK